MNLDIENFTVVVSLKHRFPEKLKSKKFWIQTLFIEILILNKILFGLTNALLLCMLGKWVCFHIYSSRIFRHLVIPYLFISKC